MKKYLFALCFIIHWFPPKGFANCTSCAPIEFVENNGQWPRQVLFRADLVGATAFFEQNTITFSVFDQEKLRNILHPADATYIPKDQLVQAHAYKMQLLNANSQAQIITTEKQSAYQNYFLGNKSNWASNCGIFHEITYYEIYPNIDLTFYSANGQLKYDFVLKPDANPSDIKWQIQGIENISLNESGELELETAVQRIIDSKPISFSDRQEYPVQFQLNKNTISFSGLPQQITETITIDPTLIFSTYSGSSANNFGYTATFDDDKHLYAGGSVFSNGYPVEPPLGAYQINFAGGNTDIGISKYAEDGSSLIYSTYLGGGAAELPHSLIVNNQNQLFVFGSTASTNFPVTESAYDTTFNGGPPTGTLTGLGVNYNTGSDMIISRISADGTQLLASTYLGGTDNDGLLLSNLKYNYADEVRGEIEIDKENNVYIVSCTRSADFPLAGNPFQANHAGGMDAVLAKLNNNLSTLIWSSFYGGIEDDAAYSITLDKNQDIFIAGGTRSSDLKISGNAVYPSFGGGLADGFVAYIDKSGSNLLQSSFVASAAYDQAYFVELNSNDEVHLLCQTQALDSTFIFNAQYAHPNSGNLILKMNHGLDSLIWSTVFGRQDGSPDISPTAFLVDLCSKVYLAGWGGSLNTSLGQNPSSSTNQLKVTPDAYQNTTDGSDFYLLVIEDDASNISYGSYFGGNISAEHVDGGTSRFDKKGIIYQSVCAGCIGNSDFPIYPHPDSVVSATNGSGACNNGVFKFDFNLPITLADFELPPTGCAPYQVQFQNESLITPTTQYFWDFGDGTTSTQQNPQHTYSQSGIYEVMLATVDPGSCNATDSIRKQLVILSNQKDSLDDILVCAAQSIQIGITPIPDSSISYAWSPSIYLNEDDVANPISTPTTDIEYQLLISNGFCTDTFVQILTVNLDSIYILGDSISCPEDTAFVLVQNSNPAFPLDYSWTPSNAIAGDSNTAAPVLIPDETTVFTVRGTNSLGCLYEDSIRVLVQNNPLLMAGTASNLCLGDSAFLVAINQRPDDTLSYNWFPTEFITSGQGTEAILVKPEESSWFYVEVINEDNCVYLDSISVVVLRNERNALADQIQCGPQSMVIGPAISDSSLSYQWFPSIGLSEDSVANPVANIANDASYVLVISNGACADTLDQQILVDQNEISINGEAEFCLNDTIQLSADVLDETQIQQFYWIATSNILGDSLLFNVSSIATQTDTFIAAFTSNAGCFYADTFITALFDTQFQIQAFAEPDTTFFGGELQLSSSPQNFQNYLWTPDLYIDQTDIANPLATNIQSSVTYIVLAEDQNSCKTTDTVSIRLLEFECEHPYIFMPNAFSPNGDDLNDELLLMGSFIESMQLRIFDRWGQLVFETNDQNLGWDGTFKGKLLEPSVYAYYLEVLCIGGASFSEQGNVTLLK